MKRTLTAVLMVATLFLATACNDTGTSNTPKGDPRDVIIKNAIKQAASASNPMELYNLFAGHPEMSKDMPMAGKLWVMANVIGSVNAHDLDLSKMKDIKLKAPAQNAKQNKWYCLSGSFSYAGPARLGSNKPEITDGVGEIKACTRDGKDGKPYLNSIEFKLDLPTVQKAWARIDAEKRAAKTAGRTK